MGSRGKALLILSSVQDTGEQLASRSGLFTPADTDVYILWIKVRVGRLVRLHALEKRKYFASVDSRTPYSSSAQPLTCISY
jgi:hypothetical protein